MDSHIPVPRPGILDIAAYVGGESKVPGVAEPARLASNESAFPPSQKAIDAYNRLARELHRYPDGNALVLREALGRHHDLDPAQIVCGAGSDELFALLALGYAGAGDEVLYSRHGFLAYPIVAQSVGATPVAAPEKNLRTDVDALLALVSPRTKIVFLANPNNPTGSYLTDAEVERLIAGLPPHVLLVLDVAYAEFVNRDDYSAGHALVARHANVVVTHTFSKIYALAALRLGWAYCPAGVASVLNRLRQPFNVSAQAIAVGIAALEDTDYVAAAQAHNERWRAWLDAALTELGLTVHPSVGNFLLVAFAPQSAEAVRLFLKARGVLVRQMGAYGLPDCLRISIGPEAEMHAVLDGLKAYFAQAGIR